MKVVRLRSRCAGERGSVITGWLAKLAVTLGVLGVLAFDLISIGASRVGAADDAGNAAIAASQAWEETHDVQQAYNAAVDAAGEHGETVDTKNFVIDPDSTVHLTVRRTAKTVVLGHIGFLAHFTHVAEAGKGQALP